MKKYHDGNKPSFAFWQFYSPREYVQVCYFSVSLLIKKNVCVPTGYLPTLYDFHFDGTQEKWVPWSSLVTKYIHNPEMKFADILGKGQFCALWGEDKSSVLHTYIWIYTFWPSQAPSSTLIPSSSIFALVPTIDTTRASWILEQMVKIKRPVLLVGESGTSKTATIHNFLKNLNADTRVSLPSNHACVHLLWHLSLNYLNFFLLFLDYSDHQLLVQNDFNGPAEEPGGQCGEKDQRDLRASHGEETASLYGWHEYAKGTWAELSTESRISFTVLSDSLVCLELL